MVLSHIVWAPTGTIGMNVRDNAGRVIVEDIMPSVGTIVTLWLHGIPLAFVFPDLGSGKQGGESAKQRLQAGKWAEPYMDIQSAKALCLNSQRTLMQKR